MNGRLDNMRTSEALHLGDLQGVFIIYGFFIAASVVTFLFEVLCWRPGKHLNNPRWDQSIIHGAGVIPHSTQFCVEAYLLILKKRYFTLFDFYLISWALVSV